MKILATILLSLGMAFASASFAEDDPDCEKERKAKKEAQNKKQNLKRVVNANPQHKGYPKADEKGNYPGRVDKNVYYIPDE